MADLTLHGEEHDVTTGPKVSHNSFWFNLFPFRGDLHITTCIRLPGLKVDGPNASYKFASSMGWYFDWIDYGLLESDGVRVCADTTASLERTENGLALEWGAIELHSVAFPGFNVSDFDYKLTPLGGLIQTTTFGPVEAIVAVIFREIFTASVDASDSEEWILKDVIKATTLANILEEMMVPMLSEHISNAESSGLKSANDLSTLCENMFPTASTSDAFFFYNRFLRMHCDAVVASGGVVSFSQSLNSDPTCFDERFQFSSAAVPSNDFDSVPWWGQFEGQQWARPDDEDTGCRLQIELRGGMDAAAWPVFKCALAEYNLWQNHGQPGGKSALRDSITAACPFDPLRSFHDLYGTSQLDADLGGIVSPITCDPEISP